MRSININNKLYINKAKDFKQHKDTLLKLIDDMPPVMAGHVSKSDWLVQGQFDRPYLTYFYKHIGNPLMCQLMRKLKAVNWRIGNGWYQQYRKGSHHKYHNHINTNFTNVFYLELPDSNYKTIIKDDNGKLISFKAKEGDLLTFPAHLLHKSKPNGDKRKTIISFNSNFFY
jgi:predicted RNA binding protein YcfA (HicA-like mRNA interferase family)